MPDNSKSAIVQGITRVKILDYINKEPYFKAAVSTISDDPIRDEIEIVSIADNLRRTFSDLIKVAPNLTEEHTGMLSNIQKPNRLVDRAVSLMTLPNQEKQDILEEINVKKRIENVFELFPELQKLQKQKAGSLSGGQQQMLSLGRVLLHEPEILLIDELSLGLAPTVVQDLLNIIERLQEKGQTMIVVEQSLNIALSIANRAVFLEKGQVRFEGSAQELVERDDLARAVFLGDEGG